MLEYKREYVKAFIGHPHGIAGNKLVCRNNMITHLFITLPTAIFGVASRVTIVILLPILAFFIFWGVLMCVKDNIEKRVDLFYLYMGSSAIDLSIVCLLAAYKTSSMIAPVSYLVVICMIFAHIAIARLVYKHIINKIKIGAYVDMENKKTQNNMAIMLCVWSLMPLLKMFINNFNNKQDIYMLIVTFGLICYSYISLFGMHFLLRYHFMKQLGKSEVC